MSISSKQKQTKEIDQSLATKIILDSVAVGVFTVDRDWNITFLNRTAENIIGIKSQKAIGKKCFDIFHSNICQSACAVEETLRTGKPLLNLPINILNHKGKIIPVAITTAVLKDEKGVFIAASDYLKALPSSIAKWIPGPFSFLGTDGFGRSDSRAALRDFFEVDARYIAFAALSALARDNQVKVSVVKKASKQLEIDPEKVSPLLS